MKLREILRFEFVYQARRLSTWLFFAVLVLFALGPAMEDFLQGARNGDYFLNAPFVVATVTALGSMAAWIIAASLAGNAAARDVQTRMHPLTYTAPVRKAGYLGGRFLAAFLLNALILLAVPAGILLTVFSSGLDVELLGPFRPAAYLTAYAFIALPNAFITTAIQFSFAALSRRAVASYLGGLLLFVVAGVGDALVGEWLGLWELARLLDPAGLTIVSDLSTVWTPIERNTRLIGLDGSLLLNRLLWVGIALGVLAFTHLGFRVRHLTASSWWSRIARRRDTRAPTPAGTVIAGSTPIAVPQVRRTFGFATRARQTLAIAWSSFRKVVKSRGGLIPLAVAVFLSLFVPAMSHLGVPMLARTEHVITHVVLGAFDDPPFVLIIPLLIAFYAGELVWMEREAGLSEIADAAPEPEWMLFLGKFLALGLVLVAWVALLMMAGMLGQVRAGYYDVELGLYLQILFGLQFADYLLWALLALVVHVLLNHKYVGHLAVFFAYVFIGGLADEIGIEHNLVLYGSAPRWSYTDMRGFGPFLGPWLWFKLYWAAWALLLAVAARLLWVRGVERGLGARLRMARRRFTRPTAGTAAAAVGLILTLGGFIFYNTNVLNEYHTAFDRMERRAEYERRFGRYEGIAQPRLTGTDLHVEIHPERREVEIRGTHRLVNSSPVAIDSIHVATEPGVETETVAFDQPATPVRADEDLGDRVALAFDRPAVLVLADEDRGHHIYALARPLEPGDSLRLGFDVHYEPRGFGNDGVGASVVANGTYFTNQWLPAIGYQRNRELGSAGDRRAHGLAPRPAIPSLDDAEAQREAFLFLHGESGVTGAGQVDFEAVVGTDEDQIAVAPGALRRTWTEGGRRYFRYSTDAPIGNEYAFFSAGYAVREEQWNDVAIQIFHHPGHAANLERMVRSVRASLDHYTAQFGPYPYSHIKLVEHPGHGVGMHAEAALIDYEEGFSLLNPEDGPGGVDLPFYVVAHEVAHQWWGSRLAARVEGAPLLSEGLASFSAYQIVQRTYGREHLRRLLTRLRASYRIPRTRADVPLLRATDPFHYYRKGPFALHALSEYMGQERVNDALRRSLEAHRSGAPPLLTSLDLYRELQAVTPDSLQYLLHDLFEANTFWELETERATAEQMTVGGTWQVTLDVRARKVVVDSAGVETEVRMDDRVEIGVFAPADGDRGSGDPIYLQMHRIRSGDQTITVTVPRRPAHAGVDPYHLLVDWELDDNIGEVEIEN